MRTENVNGRKQLHPSIYPQSPGKVLKSTLEQLTAYLGTRHIQAQHFVTLRRCCFDASQWGLRKPDTVSKIVAGAAFCELPEKLRKLRKNNIFRACFRSLLHENCRQSS